MMEVYPNRNFKKEPYVGIHFFDNKLILLVLLTVLFGSCASPEKKRAAALYKTHCASCHILPKINDLPKHIWEQGVLPEMAARMGLLIEGNDPYVGLTFEEQGARMQSGIYPTRPLISKKDYENLSNYIISLAPDSLISKEKSKPKQVLNQFRSNPIDVDGNRGTFISFLDYDSNKNLIITADLSGNITKIDAETSTITKLPNVGQPVTSYAKQGNNTYLTIVGYLNPSEIPRGYLQINNGKDNQILDNNLHRPVHTLIEDLNGDGTEEIVVCEFGHLTGSLSLFLKNDSLNYRKETLLNAPGTIRTIAKDMNADNKLDLVVLTSQGREGITIFYQTEDLEFVPETVLEFSPVYGSSWFELVDFDGDGDYDIITANGDNGDKSYVHKPYHGIRIHINNGKNTFEENYFYALNGATRLIAEDFDLDGDIDIAVLATFPDYENSPSSSFVYLENKNYKSFEFQDATFKDVNSGRWLLMDSGDFDQDGDVDIVLSSFTYGFTPVPSHLAAIWESTSTDLMILKNRLY